MAKYIISWDAGFGDGAELIEADTQEQADLAAYEALQNELDSNYWSKAEPYSKERAVELELESEEESDDDVQG